MSKRENEASDEHGQAQYDSAISGLIWLDRCDGDDDQKTVMKGYLLSMKAYAEHDLGEGDYQTDFNEANQLLVECQTTPGIYGTHEAAECETQENYNIRATTNWEMNQ
jgi:hypothetical protein